MAKKIRFPLKMNGVDVRTIEELREHFDLESVLGYFTNGKLATWLRDRYYDNEAMAVDALSANDEKLAKKLCGILKIAYAENAEEIDIAFIKRRQEKIALLRQFTNDESLVSKIDAIAFNQEDLLDILDTGTEKMIYLCKGEFDIPLTVTDITYVGFDNPVVMLRAYDNVDFSSLNLKFVDIKYGWNISNVTSTDKVYQAEQLIKIGKIDEARKILRKVVVTKNPRACYILFKINGSKEWDLIENGYDVFIFAQRANLGLEVKTFSSNVCVKTLEKMADNNDDFAMCILGFCYYCAVAGCMYNDTLAIEWYQKSIKFGNLIAMYYLGLWYTNNDFEEEAVKIWQKSAEKGYIGSQKELAIYYEIDVGSDEKAFEWFQKAAEQGDITGQFSLGDYYANGEVVEKNLEEAVKWYRLVARNESLYDRFPNLERYFNLEDEAKNRLKKLGEDW